MPYATTHDIGSESGIAWGNAFSTALEEDTWLLNSTETMDSFQDENLSAMQFESVDFLIYAGALPGAYALGGLVRERRRLRYHQQLVELLKRSVTALPATATAVSQGLLDSLLEFAPHELGISLVVDEDQEVSLVLTAYWPTGTLHVEHFFHFPADDPDDTVVNFYASPTAPALAPERKWGWYCPVPTFQQRLRNQLRNGQWPLEQGW